VGDHCNYSPREPENLVKLQGTIPDLQPFISATLVPLTFALFMRPYHFEYSLFLIFTTRLKGSWELKFTRQVLRILQSFRM